MKRTILTPALLLFLIISFTYSQAQDKPPVENDKVKADLIELIKLDKSIKLDIRYATADNFTGRAVYPEARAFLQRPAAEAVVRVHQKLKEKGLGLVIFDGYRPWAITKLFWDTVSPDQRKFVADPAKGSKHNRGCAVDLSIYDRKTGALLDMPSGYDEFTERASPDYRGGTDLQTKNRELLRSLMEAEGFTVNPNEWWHFDYKDWQDYAIYDISFSAIRNLDELEGLWIRRIEFAGPETVRDRIMRGSISLKEDDIFSLKNLKKSVKGINSLGLFEKITEQQVSWWVDKENKTVDILFHLKERKKK